MITTAKPLSKASLMARVDLSMPSRCSVPYQCACSTRSFTKLPTFPMPRIHPQIPFSYVFDPTDPPWPWRPVLHRVLRVGAWTAPIPRARANAGAVLRLTPPLPPGDLSTQTTRTTRHPRLARGVVGVRALLWRCPRRRRRCSRRPLGLPGPATMNPATDRRSWSAYPPLSRRC